MVVSPHSFIMTSFLETQTQVHFNGAGREPQVTALEREEGITAGVSLLGQRLLSFTLEVPWGEHGCFLWGGGRKRGAGAAGLEDIHGHPTAQTQPPLQVLMSLGDCSAGLKGRCLQPRQFRALGFLSLSSRGSGQPRRQQCM